MRLHDLYSRLVKYRKTNEWRFIRVKREKKTILKRECFRSSIDEMKTYLCGPNFIYDSPRVHGQLMFQLKRLRGPYLPSPKHKCFHVYKCKGSTVEELATYPSQIFFLQGNSCHFKMLHSNSVMPFQDVIELL